MSSILLLLDDGEMHPLMTDASGSQIVLRGANDDGGDDHPDAVITSDGETFALGSHFLTTEDLVATTAGHKDTEGNLVTKIEVDSVPVEYVIEKSNGQSRGGSRKALINKVMKEANKGDTDRKVCLWPTHTGATCGKTFTKFDSLKRHLQEAHKGLRPFACTLCEKSYGRRDYLQRHLKSHNANYAVNLAGGTSSSSVMANATAQAAAHIVKKVHMGKEGSTPQSIVVQVPQNLTGGGTVQVLPSSSDSLDDIPTTLSKPNVTSPTPSGRGPNPLPFFSLSGQLPTAKPMGSKICRWVQNDGTVCGKAFSKLDSLRRHVNELHKGVRPFACDLCDKSYGRRDYLDRHLRTHDKKAKMAAARVEADGIDWGPNSGVLLAGDEEPLSVPPRMPKKKRKDIPPEEKKICLWILEDGTACGKTFTKFDSLKRHVAEAHKGIRPYACSLCGKNYGRRDYLLRHLKYGHGNDIDISNLTIQKVRNNPSQHPETKPNPSSALSSSALPSINFGTSVPPPGSVPPASAKRKALADKKTCKWALEDGTICGKTFTKFDSLRRHVSEMHKSIRPFKCDLCPKNYGRKDYLDRHRRMHLDGTVGNEGSPEESAPSSLVPHDDGMSLDMADVAGSVTGHVVDSDDEEDTSGIIVVGGSGGANSSRPSRGFRSSRIPTKTMRIDNDDMALGAVEDDEDDEMTTTTTVVVETGAEDEEEDESDLLSNSVITVVSAD